VSAEARKLAAAMRAAAPRAEEDGGELRRSIRVSTTGKLAVTIRAGGRLTTTPSGYDYSLAIEFGNEKSSAQPFFWPSYRAGRNAVIAAIHTSFRNALKEAWNVQ
jgi:HK97 gp10 family phage protein